METNLKETQSYTVGLCVDAGSISITTKSFIEKMKGKIPEVEYIKIIECKKGDIIKVFIDDCYIEKIKGKFKVFREDCWREIIKGKFKVIEDDTIFIGDLCYCFEEHKSWMDLLSATDYLQHKSNDYTTVNTGGDGCFDTVITVYSSAL